MTSEESDRESSENAQQEERVSLTILVVVNELFESFLDELIERNRSGDEVYTKRRVSNETAGERRHTS